MKNSFFLLLILMVASCSVVSAQESSPVSYKLYYEKGARMAGGSFSLFRSGLSESKTQLDIGGYGDRIGLNISPQYGVFVARNWMIGGYGILGYATENDGYFFANTNSFGWGYSYNRGDGREHFFDIGAAAFTRYYAPLSKANVVSLFFHGAIPVVYSSSEFKTNISSPVYNTSAQRLRASFELGVGAACNGALGSFEMMLSFRGLSIGFYRALSPRKK